MSRGIGRVTGHRSIEPPINPAGRTADYPPDGSARIARTGQTPARASARTACKMPRIHLTGLSEKSSVKAIRVETPTGPRWEFGLNTKLLHNAEFLKDEKDARQGDLFVQPDRELTGQRLKVGVLYEDASLDSVAVVAGRCDHKLRMPASPLPKIEELAMSAKWLGSGREQSRTAG